MYEKHKVSKHTKMSRNKGGKVCMYQGTRKGFRAWTG
jgi:hypothetical protein